jgi:hypothetical protein
MARKRNRKSSSTLSRPQHADKKGLMKDITDGVVRNFSLRRARLPARRCARSVMRFWARYAHSPPTPRCGASPPRGPSTMTIGGVRREPCCAFPWLRHRGHQRRPRPGSGRLLQRETHAQGRALPESALAALPQRTGSTPPDIPYTPLSPQSILDVDAIAFLCAVTYTRAAVPLPG